MADWGNLLLREGDSQGREWLERAAAGTSWRAAYKLYSLAQEPAAQSLWRDRTIELTAEAAEADDAKAMVLLSSFVLQSEPDRAIQLSRRAARAGNVQAMGQLSLLLADREPDEALYWEEQAVAEGDANALLRRGNRLQKEDPDESMRCLLLAAKKGQTSAMEMIGHALYLRGERAQALRWYRDAAERNDPSAMINLARLLYYENREESIAWLRRAAENGRVAAMKMLAAVLEPTDWDQARSWMQRACDSGDDDACIMVRQAPIAAPKGLRALFYTRAAEDWLHRTKRSRSKRHPSG